MRPVSLCCQSYQREWQHPQKVTSKLQYIWTMNYLDNNNERYSWQVARSILSLSSWRRLQTGIGPLVKRIRHVVKPPVLKDIEKKGKEDHRTTGGFTRLVLIGRIVGNKNVFLKKASNSRRKYIDLLISNTTQRFSSYFHEYISEPEYIKIYKRIFKTSHYPGINIKYLGYER